MLQIGESVKSGCAVWRTTGYLHVEALATCLKAPAAFSQLLKRVRELLRATVIESGPDTRDQDVKESGEAHR
jgi:hypothetical protein